MSTKNFSPRLYEDSDTRAKKAVSRVLRKDGWDIDSKETMNADIVATKRGRTTYHEVEIKKVWTSIWPLTWDTIQIPARKERLFEKVDDLDDLFFWIIREDTGAAWAIKGSAVKASPKVEVKNRFIPNGEYFFQVPISEAILLNF